MNDISDALPVVFENNRWFLRLPPGSLLFCSHHFDSENGYRVMLMLQGSGRANGFGPVRARQLADQIERDEPEGSFLIRLADNIREQADWCERMNEAWALIGHPAAGFDSQTSGNA